MREIKYKAWCEKLNMVCRVLSIDFLNKDILVVIDEIRANQLVLHYGEYELLQFTGLLDKQGAEIYKNDIIKDTDYLFVIKWQSGGFVLSPIALSEGAPFIGNQLPSIEFATYISKSCELIGNTNENTELLKDM